MDAQMKEGKRENASLSEKLEAIQRELFEAKQKVQDLASENEALQKESMSQPVPRYRHQEPAFSKFSSDLNTL